MVTTSDKLLKKPDWIKVKAPQSDGFKGTYAIARELKLNTVCEEAACPNIGECWQKKHATFMILGSVCTRACAFCNIKTGKPDKVNEDEPENLAEAILALGLKHAVITSVDRDDLEDGGANHFALCIQEIRKTSPNTTIEILTPDFKSKKGAVEKIVTSKPDVFNHNIETVPKLYNRIRPGAGYFHSLNLLWRVKQIDSSIFTKSGIMLGLGETKEEVLQVMNDFKAAGVDFITIGQYLQPSSGHAKVERFVTPEEFSYYARVAKAKGFSMISSSPLTRSSYHADSDFENLKKAKNI